MLMQWTDCSMANHTGTHLDAPVHFFPSGKALDDYPLDTFFGPAVLLRVSKGPFGVVTADDLINAGEDVRPGDIVLIRTGWGAKYGEPDYHTHPSFTEDAAQWLVEQGAKIVGFDQITPEIAWSVRPPGYRYPVHRTLLRNEIFIIEHINLERLGETRATVAAFPISIKGANGAQARVVAMVE
jgi:arylformamidase